MTVNPKTVALLKASGKGLNKMMRLYTVRQKNGVFLKIPKANGEFFLVRLVSKHTYLGAVISYGNFELLTMAHRIKAAVKTSGTLQHWLRGHGGLTHKQRALLWMQCVFTCAIHSLLAVGLTMQALLKLDRFCLLQLRHIYNQPVHLDHITHSQFLRQYNLKDPILVLRKRCLGAMERGILRQQESFPDDLFHHWTTDWLLSQLSVIDSFLQFRRSKPAVVAPVPTPFVCSECDCSFSTLALLRRHQTRKHSQPRGRLRIFDFARDARNGVPTCGRCTQPFTTWHMLKHHVEFVCSLPLCEATAEIQEFHSLRQQLQNWAVNDPSQHPGDRTCAVFCTRCALCNKFNNSLRSMKYHHLVDHPEEHAMLDSELRALLQATNMLDPPKNSECRFCCTRIRRRHDCILLRQAALLAANAKLAATPDPSFVHVAADDALVYSCTVCSKQYLSQHALKLHMLKHAPAQPFDQTFDMCRDFLPGNQCAHCMKKFPALPSLERHVKLYCSALDPKRKPQTLLDTDEHLRQDFQGSDVNVILRDERHLEVLSKTCILYRSSFGRKWTFKGTLGHSMHCYGCHHRRS